MINGELFDGPLFLLPCVPGVSHGLRERRRTIGFVGVEGVGGLFVCGSDGDGGVVVEEEDAARTSRAGLFLFVSVVVGGCGWVEVGGFLSVGRRV